MKSVSKSELGLKLLEHLREVEDKGEALIVTDNGKPVIRIEPYFEGDEELRTLRGVVVRYDDPLDPV